MLKVTSIALGNPRLAIVNGKGLAESDWLVVTTPSGDHPVRVTKIEEGVVHFANGRQTIEARLSALAAEQAEP